MKTTNKFQAYNLTAEETYWYVEYFDETGTVDILVYITEAEANAAIEDYIS
jgi:hypothetical protein